MEKQKKFNEHHYKMYVEMISDEIRNEPVQFPDEDFAEDDEWDLAVKKKYSKTMNYITINIYK